MNRCAMILLALTSLLALAGSSMAQEFWYEDNNMRRAGGYPEDFREMFEKPETWSEMRGKLSVYYIRGNTLRNVIRDLGEKWVVRHFCGLLKKEKLPVAVDNPAHFKSIQLLQKNGVTVSHIALQSVLSKFEKSRMKPAEQNAEIRRRIDKSVTRLVELRKTFPKTKIGIICALPTKGLPYEWPYKELVKKSTAAGAPLQFIHVDAPYSCIERTIKWENLSRIKKTISQDLKLEFGLIVTDNIGGMKSNKAFHDKVMLVAKKYPTAAYPDYFIMMSWYNHPKYSVRKEGSEGQYTMTRTALDFFNAISEKTGRKPGAMKTGSRRRSD